MCKTKKKHSFHYVLFCDLIILRIKSAGMSVMTLFIKFDYLGKMSELRAFVFVQSIEGR
jgi:hypothetical protein